MKRICEAIEDLFRPEVILALFLLFVLAAGSLNSVSGPRGKGMSSRTVSGTSHFFRR